MGMMGVGSKGGYLRSSVVSNLHGAEGADSQGGSTGTPQGCHSASWTPHFFF